MIGESLSFPPKSNRSSEISAAGRDAKEQLDRCSVSMRERDSPYLIGTRGKKFNDARDADYNGMRAAKEYKRRSRRAQRHIIVARSAIAYPRWAIAWHGKR